jgi:hypothetical protein
MFWKSWNINYLLLSPLKTKHYRRGNQSFYIIKVNIPISLSTSIVTVYWVRSRILLIGEKPKIRYFEKKRQIGYIIYIIVRKRNEFLKSNLKRELSECSKVILRIIRDMNKNNSSQYSVVENILRAFNFSELCCVTYWQYRHQYRN